MVIIGLTSIVLAIVAALKASDGGCLSLSGSPCGMVG